MANLVVQAASDVSSVVKVTQPGISSSAVVAASKSAASGSLTINGAADVDSSAITDNSILVWNTGISRYELKAFTDLAFDAGLMD